LSDLKNQVYCVAILTESSKLKAERISLELLRIIKCIGISTIYWPPARSAYDSERITMIFKVIVLGSRIE